MGLLREHGLLARARLTFYIEVSCEWTVYFSDLRECDRFQRFESRSELQQQPFLCSVCPLSLSTGFFIYFVAGSPDTAFSSQPRFVLWLQTENVLTGLLFFSWWVRTASGPNSKIPPLGGKTKDGEGEWSPANLGVALAWSFRLQGSLLILAFHETGGRPMLTVLTGFGGLFLFFSWTRAESLFVVDSVGVLTSNLTVRAARVQVPVCRRPVPRIALQTCKLSVEM